MRKHGPIYQKIYGIYPQDNFGQPYNHFDEFKISMYKYPNMVVKGYKESSWA
jgi:hypothetical protein